MRVLSSLNFRVFVCSWIVLAVHFATNTVREHYPAFSLVQDGTFRVDKYWGFHTDIFIHKDGHAYIGNNVAASVIAAIPLLLFNPILDRLETYEKAQIRRDGVPPTQYRNEDHPNSQKFFEVAKQAGLTLRFGASAAITSVFLMAPLSALMIVLMLRILVDRGVLTERALILAFLFGFGTPVFFRTGVLNHNMMLMYATFVAFHLIWVRPGQSVPSTTNCRLAAGFLCGVGLALDYSGVIPLIALFFYLIGTRLRTASLQTSIRESVPFVLASIPPVLFLLYSQWSMFGDPFRPGQYWMPDVSHNPVFGDFQNPYSTQGFRGFGWPSLDLVFLNLFDPSYGMYVYGPLLVLGLIPVCFYKRDELIFPRSERRFATGFFLAFLIFSAANQYSRIQFNSGFRYLVPLVPIIFLASADHLVRMRRRWLTVIAVPALLNSWFISMVREPVPKSWSRVLTEGIQFPWLTVLRLTAPKGHTVLGSPFLPIAIGALTALAVLYVWRIGEQGRTKPAGSSISGPLQAKNL